MYEFPLELVYCVCTVQSVTLEPGSVQEITYTGQRVAFGYEPYTLLHDMCVILCMLDVLDE